MNRDEYRKVMNWLAEIESVVAIIDGLTPKENQQSKCVEVVYDAVERLKRIREYARDTLANLTEMCDGIDEDDVQLKVKRLNFAKRYSYLLVR